MLHAAAFVFLLITAPIWLSAIWVAFLCAVVLAAVAAACVGLYMLWGAAPWAAASILGLLVMWAIYQDRGA